MDYIIDIPDDDDREGDDEEVSTRQGAGKDATPVISGMFFALCSTVVLELFLGTFWMVAGFASILTTTDTSLKLFRVGFIQLIIVSPALMAMKWGKRHCWYIHFALHYMLGICYCITFSESIEQKKTWMEETWYFCFALFNVSLLLNFETLLQYQVFQLWSGIAALICCFSKKAFAHSMNPFDLAPFKEDKPPTQIPALAAESVQPNVQLKTEILPNKKEKQFKSKSAKMAGATTSVSYFFLRQFRK